MATIIGTSGNDLITPSGVSTGVSGGIPSVADDTITGEGGNDTINPGLGDDFVSGGTDNDLLVVDYSTLVVPVSSSRILRSITDSSGNFVGYSSDIEQLNLTGGSTNDDLEGTNGNDTLAGNGGNDTLQGFDGNDVLNGGAGNDFLVGGTGINTLIGGTSNDTADDANFSGATTNITIVSGTSNTFTASDGTTINSIEFFDNLTLGGGNDRFTSSGSREENIYGGAGNDTINPGLGDDFVSGGTDNDLLLVNYSTLTVPISSSRVLRRITDSSGNDVRYSNIEQLSLTGGSANDDLEGTNGNDTLAGNGGNDTLQGFDGDDILNGGGGIDSLIGGSGNDVYQVDGTTDVISELAGQGTDTVQSSVTFSLATLANIENLTLTGATAINGTGNILNNTITGNSANNILNGGEGIDKLIGGLGNDVYQVDSTTDVISELAGQGTDKVQSSVTFSLATLANIENLTLTGAGAINGTGNALSNGITGNGGNNILNGGTGADTLNGGGGIDRLIGGLGNDVYQVDSTTDVISESAGQGTDKVESSVTFTLGANIENLTLTGAGTINGRGNALNNTITGNGANNILNGDGGIDNLIGGLGNDVYQVDSTTDIISESAGQGTDKVESSVTFTLGANIENLTLTGAGAINGIGNTLNNTITGNSGNNTLNGAAGNDTLTGGGGNDSLTGGAGADDFRFNSPSDKLDRITDFSLAQGDEIVVSATGFGGGLVAGADITAAQFFLGVSANDASDRFIYNITTGALFFDRDGNGSSFAQVQIATLSTGVELNSDDIFVVA